MHLGLALRSQLALELMLIENFFGSVFLLLILIAFQFRLWHGIVGLGTLDSGEFPDDGLTVFIQVFFRCGFTLESHNHAFHFILDQFEVLLKLVNWKLFLANSLSRRLLLFGQTSVVGEKLFGAGVKFVIEVLKPVELLIV